MLLRQIYQPHNSIPLGAILFVSQTLALQSEVCLPGIVKMLEQGPNHYDPTWFFTNGTNTSNPVLTLGGCQALCEPPGSKRWHYDAGQRITAWLLPIVVLVLNLDVSPLDKWRYIEVAHVLGDPICSLSAMLAKVSIWAWCAAVAKREHHRYGLSSKELGILMAGIEEVLVSRQHPLQALDELLESLGPRPVQTTDNELDCRSSTKKQVEVSDLRTAKAASLKTLPGQANTVAPQPLRMKHPELKHPEPEAPESATKAQPDKFLKSNSEVASVLRDTASLLADGRSDDILRTLTAVILYLLSFIGAYVNAIGGGNNSPPAGRVALAIYLSWIIPVVLLSNTIGGFASRRTCFNIVQRMVIRVQESTVLSRDKTNPSRCTILEDTLNEREAFFGNQRWQGGSDVYRPGKHVPFEDNAPRISSKTLLFLAISPLVVSLSFSFAILWMIPPRGIDCRLMVPITITTAWLLSALCTDLTWRFRLFTPRQHWYFTALKDAVVGLAAVLTIFLTHSGLFNTCDCASFRLMYGERARVPLNVYYDSGHLSATLFPVLASLCLFFEIMTFVVMCIVGKEGLRLMRWSESSKMKRFLELNVP